MRIDRPTTIASRKFSDWSEASSALSLGRQTLAALRAATGENLLTTGGQHALAEAVTALANNTARLIRALHGSLRPNKFRFHRDAREKRIMLLFPMVRKAAAPSVKPTRNAISPEFWGLIICARRQVNARKRLSRPILKSAQPSPRTASHGPALDCCSDRL